MPQDPALTAPEIAALAGPSAPRWYMVYDTNGGSNLVATARVNAPSGLTYPLSVIPVDTTSGGWANIAFNQTIFIGSTPGGFDKGVYRVPKSSSTPTTLAIQAIGPNDSGELNVGLRTTGIADDDYITILNRFDVFGVNPRINYVPGVVSTIFEDWAVAYANFNRFPPPIVNITIDGQPANYATHVYGATSKTLNITFTITLWATSSSATWVTTLPAGWTLNSGSLSGSGLTNTINVTIPHSADSYTLQFDAQENNGAVWTAYRKVWIKSNTYPPILIAKFDTDTDDRVGSHRTITILSLPSMPPGAMVHLFDMGTWNGTDVPTAIKCFSGYVEKRTEHTDTGVASVTLDLIGPSYLMGLIGSQSQIVSSQNTNPTTWQQVYNLLSYLDFIIWWIIASRASGLLQMFNYTPFGLANTSHRMTDWRIDTGTLLSQVQIQAARYGGGNFGCDSTGEMQLQRNYNRIPYADRASVPVRAIINASIYSSAKLDFDERPHVRRLRGECFVSDGLTTNTPVWCDAPPIGSQGSSEEKLEKIIADSANELYVLTGNEYAARNNPYPNGDLTIQKNYAVIKPAQMLPIELQIASNLRYDGVAFDAKVLPMQVTRTHNVDGTIDTQVTFEGETAGVPATDVPIPVPDASTYSSPSNITPFAPVPPWVSPNPNPAGTPAGPTPTTSNGSTGFMATGTQAFTVKNITGTPQYVEVTPSTLGAFTIRHGMLQTGGKKAWILASDGTNSAVWYTSNVFAAVVSWSKGANQTGIYTLIRVDNITGDLLIEGSGTEELSYNFIPNAAGWTPVIASGQALGNYVLGSGWEDTFPTPGPSDSIGIISPSFSARNVDTVVFHFNTSWGGPNPRIEVLIDTYPIPITVYGSSGATGTLVSVACSGAIGITALQINADPLVGGGLHFAGFITGIDILTVSGNTQVCLSSDNGATFGSPVIVGGSPGLVAGFDLQRSGTVTYAASLNKIRKATTLGGAYSDLIALTSVNAALIEVPWYTRNSNTTLNSGGSPEFIYGLSTADGSGFSLYWVVGGTPVNITPMIGGFPGLALDPNCLVTWKGTMVAASLFFNGVVHLVTSVDAGTTWVDRGVVSPDYLRLRRLSATPGQLYLAGTVFDYSASFGASLTSKPKPSSGFLVFFEAYN